MPISAEIDWAATKSKFDELYSQTKVAHGLGMSKTVFCQILNGTYDYMTSPSAQRAVAKMEELNVLVRKKAA